MGNVYVEPPLYITNYSVTLKLINLVPKALMVLIGVCAVYSFLKQLKNQLSKEKSESENENLKRRIDPKPLAAFIFISLWFLLATWYCYTNKNNLNISSISAPILLKKLFHLLLNVFLSFICIWLSLFFTQISANKLYIIILTVAVLIFLFFIIKSFTDLTLSGLIARIVVFATAIFAFMFFGKQIKRYLDRFRKACKDLFDMIEILFSLYFISSFIFLLQMICLANIINQNEPSILLYIVLIFVFEWSYNFFTQFVHVFTTYLVFCRNAENLKSKIPDKNSESSIYNFPFAEAISKISVTALRPTIFQLIPGISYLYPDISSQSSDNALYRIFDRAKSVFPTIADVLNTEMKEDLEFWAFQKGKNINSYVNAQYKKQDQKIGLIAIISNIRNWIFRIPLILLTFSFLGLEKGDYVIDYNILTFAHSSLKFFKETLNNPDVSSISYILTILIFSCFFLSIESSFVANQSLFEEIVEGQENVGNKSTWEVLKEVFYPPSTGSTEANRRERTQQEIDENPLIFDKSTTSKKQAQPPSQETEESESPQSNQPTQTQNGPKSNITQDGNRSVFDF